MMKIMGFLDGKVKAYLYVFFGAVFLSLMMGVLFLFKSNGDLHSELQSRDDKISRLEVQVDEYSERIEELTVLSSDKIDICFEYQKRLTEIQQNYDSVSALYDEYKKKYLAEVKTGHTNEEDRGVQTYVVQNSCDAEYTASKLSAKRMLCEKGHGSVSLCGNL